jgi:Trk K+ transport system NAD-binding subunit
VGPVLLIGAGDLAEETGQALTATGAEVLRIEEPDEQELRQALEAGVGRVVVVSGDDAVALRVALMVRFADPDVPMLVTIFEPTIAREVRESIEHCVVTSMADIVAPSLAGPCLADDLVAVRDDVDPPVGIRETDDGVEEVPLRLPRRRRALAVVQSVARPYDKSAALMLWGALGLVALLLVETAVLMAGLGQGLIDALYGSAKTIVTVDPADGVGAGPKWVKSVLTATMIVALVLEAAFTAGLVNRLIDRRLTGLVGRRAMPRRDHVVVVGMGQVGLRLCRLLADCGIGVVAVDDREDGENVGLAREMGLPVVIGRGGDQSVLRRLSLHRARAVAAVTDDDLENLSIAMAARAVEPGMRVVLRVGDGRVANETRSLFRIGVVRDVHRIAAALLAAQATGSAATRVVCRGDDAHLLHEDGQLERAPIAATA